MHGTMNIKFIDNVIITHDFSFTLLYVPRGEYFIISFLEILNNKFFFLAKVLGL